MTKARDPKVKPKRTRPTTPTNPTSGSFQVSDALWEVLVPLLPQRVNTHPLGGGRPRIPKRTCANGIFYVDWTFDQAGDHYWRMEGTGAVIAAAENSERVRTSQSDRPAGIA